MIQRPLLFLTLAVAWFGTGSAVLYVYNGQTYNLQTPCETSGLNNINCVKASGSTTCPAALDGKNYLPTPINEDCLVPDYLCCENITAPCDLDCNGNGTCVFNPIPPDMVCECNPGFDPVDNCSIDYCSPNPCVTGSCNGITTSPFFNCTCPPGYTGDTCELDACETQSNPCDVNDATATCALHPDDSSQVVCTCDEANGWSGDLCQENVCEPDPCSVNTIECMPLNATDYFCNCSAGYKGDDCTELVCPPDICNNGTCEEIPEKQMICDCDEGYVGDFCETEIPCGVVNEPRIIGGSDVPQYQRPWDVTILNNDDTVLGAGVIIHSEWILTSANIASRCADSCTVIFASNNRTLALNNASKVLNVTEGIVHPDFDAPAFLYPITANITNHSPNNIGLLRVGTPITYGFERNRPCKALPREDYGWFPEPECTVAGFGRDSTTAPLDPEIKQEIAASLPLPSSCSAAFDGQLAPESNCITAMGAICQNDEGAAVVCKKDGVWYLQGIVINPGPPISGECTGTGTVTPTAYGFVAVTEQNEYAAWITSVTGFDLV